MKSKKEFLEHYNQISKQDLELKDKQEKLMVQKNLGWLKHLWVVLGFLLLVIMISFVNLGDSMWGMLISPAQLIFIAFISVFVLLVVYVFVPAYKRQAVFQIINEKYKGKLIKFLMEDKTYSFNKDAYIEQNHFVESNLYGYFNRYNGEDLTTLVVPSKNGDFVVRMADLDVEQVTEHKNGTTTTTIFNGVFGYVVFAKKYAFELSVNQKCGREKVGLESIEFNKKYKIYSNDQILSRMILTPDKMEKFLKYEKQVKINFVGNKMFFGISGAKLFNPEIDFKNKKVLVDDIYSDIECMLDVFGQLDEILKVLE